MNSTTAIPAEAPSNTYRAPLRERLRVRWQNWRCRHIGKAVRTLEKAMRDDPDYAHTWQCNIAMPIYDMTRSLDGVQPMRIEHANAIADGLMAHLFAVKAKSVGRGRKSDDASYQSKSCSLFFKLEEYPLHMKGQESGVTGRRQTRNEPMTELPLPPSPPTDHRDCISIRVPLAELTSRSPRAMPPLHSGLPQVPQFMRYQVDYDLLFGKRDGGQVAAARGPSERGCPARTVDAVSVGYTATLHNPSWIAVDADNHELGRYSSPRLAVGAPMVTRSLSVGAPSIAASTVLKRDVESRHASRTAKTDDLAQPLRTELGVVCHSHFLFLAFLPSLMRARTYSVPASKQNSLRRLSSRMPITPRGYSVMTRLGLTPCITEARVFRLTTLDCSSDVMHAYYIKRTFGVSWFRNHYQRLTNALSYERFFLTSLFAT